MGKINVALVDDHKLFREGLSKLVQGYEEFAVCIEADNGKDLIEKLKNGITPSIVLLDINMREMDGFDTARWLRQHYPDLKILALSMMENENSIIRMLRCGANGYVLKDIHSEELHRALCLLASKGFYYTELVTTKLVHAINSLDGEKKQGFGTLVSLNQKEIDFLKLVCTELTYKEIAEKMNLSPHTIDGYREALFEKLNVKSRVGLVLYAIRNNVVILDGGE